MRDVTNFDSLRGRGAKRGRGDWKKALSLPHRLIFDKKDDICRLVQHQLELISEAAPSLLMLEVVVAVWERGGGR